MQMLRQILSIQQSATQNALLFKTPPGSTAVTLARMGIAAHPPTQPQHAQKMQAVKSFAQALLLKEQVS